MNALLTIKGLHKNFNGVHALDGIDLALYPGKILGIVGPNGAGKTTLFNVISGIQRLDSGSIFFETFDIGNAPPNRVARCGILRTFQSPRVFRNMTPLKNILLSNMPNDYKVLLRSLFWTRTEGWECPETVRLAMSKLHEMGIAEKSSLLAGELSFGEQKLVEIARAGFLSPKVLLLDEPSTGLNTERQERVRKKLVEFSQKGVAIALIEHNIPFLLKCVDHICILAGGKITDTFARSDTNEEKLREILGLW